MQRYGVIMAGGGGTRFWPLSRKRTPKQMLNLTGNDLLICESVDRLAGVVEKENIFIVTGACQREKMLQATAGRVLPDRILSEPEARNTTACIGYAALKIIQEYGDGVMIIMPSDHYISNEDGLRDVLRIAVDEAERTDRLITVGIRPDRPATGFGYIRYDENGEGCAKRVIEFREKPNVQTAQRYVDSGKYLWNSGMFIWRAGAILEKIREYVPDIHADLSEIAAAMGTENENRVLQETYRRIRKISIDYAVMEPAAAQGDVRVIPGDFGWNDVGSWDMIPVLHQADANGNVLLGNVLAMDTTGSVCSSDGRLVAVLGLKDVVVVETPDAVLVCDKNRAQDVKEIVALLERQGQDEYL